MPYSGLHFEFPLHADLIAGLRRDDAQFAEVCSDYELLLSDYNRLCNTSVCDKDTFLADVEETLAALREEIAGFLG